MTTILRACALALPILVATIHAESAEAQSASVMTRSDPRISEVRLEIELFQQASLSRTVRTTVNGVPVQGAESTGPVYTANTLEIAMPLLLRTSWCDTDFSKIQVRALADGHDARLDPAKVFRRLEGVEALCAFDLAFPRGTFDTLLVRTVYQVQRWELKVDETAAARATWPRQWPTGMDRYLGAELGIDPANAAIKAFADSATPGGSRSVTPFHAARNAVFAITRRWRVTNSSTSAYGQRGALRGLNFTVNAPWGFEAGGGTPVELAVTCVSAVRSLGIPSRVVYCLERDDRTRRDDAGERSSRSEFRMICEFFLPEIGWIPFDPLYMASRSGAVPTGHAIPNGPIKGFANIPDLQSVLPIAFRQVPAGYEMADRYALWGWKGKVSVDADRAVSRIDFDTSSRGNGKPASQPAPIGDQPS